MITLDEWLDTILITEDKCPTYYSLNREKCLAKAKAYYYKNRDIILEKNREYNRKYYKNGKD